MAKLPDIARDMRINPEALDEEWLEQPELLYSYMELEAEAKRDLALAENHKSELRVQLKRQGATGGEALIGCKPTADNLDAWVRDQPEYVKARDTVTEAQAHLDKMQAAVAGMRERRVSLENLTTLVKIQYFSANTEMRDLNGYRMGLHNGRSVNVLRKNMASGAPTEESEKKTPKHKPADAEEVAKAPTADKPKRSRARKKEEVEESKETPGWPPEDLGDLNPPHPEDENYEPPVQSLRGRLRTSRGAKEQ